jgi:hypothetical protein
MHPLRQMFDINFFSLIKVLICSGRHSYDHYSIIGDLMNPDPEGVHNNHIVDCKMH